LRDINNIQVSANFKLREFQCKGGSREVVLHRELLERLQQLRANLGLPVHINSGYRTPEHNVRVGGSPKSYHLRGMAADIVVPGVVPGELAAAARKTGFRGIGIYNNFLHVDIRENNAEWRG